LVVDVDASVYVIVAIPEAFVTAVAIVTSPELREAAERVAVKLTFDLTDPNWSLQRRVKEFVAPAAERIVPVDGDGA